MITDTDQETHGEPKIFTLGDHQVVRCLDLAIQQLNAGAKAKIGCPSYYAYGGARVLPTIGGAPVPQHSDMDFEVSIEDCDLVPEKKEVSNKHPAHHGL